MHRKPLSFLLLLFAALLLMPRHALANHGVDALAGLEVIFEIGIAVLVITLINFIISLFNISRKRIGVSIINIGLSLPALAVSLWLCYCKLFFGLLPLFCVFVQALIIYASFGKRHEEDI